MSGFQLFVNSVKPGTLLVAASSAVAGTAGAVAVGRPDWLTAFFCLLFAVTGQTASNLMMCWLDEKKHWGGNSAQVLRKRSGDEPLTAVFREGMNAFTLLAATAGLYLLAVSGWWTLVVAAILTMLVYAINVGDNPVDSSPWILLATFMIYGVVGVLGTSFAQEAVNTSILLCFDRLGAELLLCAVTGLQAVNAHLAFGIVAEKIDIRRHRRTFLIRIGHRTACTSYAACSLLIFILMLLTPGITGTAPQWWWILPAVLLLGLNLSVAAGTIGFRHGRRRLLTSYWTTLAISVSYLAYFLSV